MTAIQTDEDLKIVVGDRAFALSPLTLGALRKGKLLDVMSVVNSIKGGELPGAEHLEGMIRFVTASAKAAAPDVTAEDFNDAIDSLPFMDGMTAILTAFKLVMVASKFTSTVSGKLSPGEAKGP